MSAEQAARVLAEPAASSSEPVATAFDSEIVPLGVPSAIPESHDRLVRHLFDIGLRLHSVRTVFEDDAADPEQIRAAGGRVLEVLDDLDTLIRDAGLTMLELAVRPDPARPKQVRPSGNGRPARRRRR